MASKCYSVDEALEFVMADDDSVSELEFSNCSSDDEDDNNDFESDPGMNQNQEGLYKSGENDVFSKEENVSTTFLFVDSQESADMSTGSMSLGSKRSHSSAAATLGIDSGQWRKLSQPEMYDPWIQGFDQNTRGYSGTQVSVTTEPLGFFSLFLDDEVFDLLTDETNRYANQFMLKKLENLPTRSRFREWKPVSTSEMKAFLSLHLAMGLVEKHDIYDHWDTFWLTETPGFGRVMSRDRFRLILTFLHFVDNEKYVERGKQGHDMLFKIRPLLNCIIPKFAFHFTPGKELSLDEMTIAFKGRHFLKLYNPKKPDKWGFKAFVLSESSSGYVLDWSLYSGKTTSCKTHSVTYDIVNNLMKPYLNKGHELYMDSYYTSVSLAFDLALHGTGLCGTINSNRQGMPKDLKPGLCPLKKGDDPVFMRKGKLLVCAWHDTKRVTMLSTLHDNSCVAKRIRSKSSVTGFRDLQKPSCVASYNAHMGGVDTSDQRMKTYLFPHRSRKWYFRIFDAIVSISMVNSHIIYRNVKHENLSLKHYILKVCTGLLEGYHQEDVKLGRRISGEVPQRLLERHFIEPANGTRPDCEVCSDRSVPKGRRQTRFRCKQCLVGLCPYPCFERYHTLKHYKLCHLEMAQ